MKKLTPIATDENLDMWDKIISGSDTLISECISQIAKKAAKGKEDVIRQKFEAAGFGNLLNNIEARRFKKVVVEQHPDCEKWFADNGTDDGVLIVTFLHPNFEMPVFDNGIYRAEMSLKYF